MSQPSPTASALEPQAEASRPQAAILRYRFGRFTLLPRSRQLLRDDIVLPLGARAFDLLLVLIQGRDRVVDKDELMRQVWPVTVVGDNNLYVQIAALRRTLGAAAVITAAGRGYRFGLEIEGSEPWIDRRRPAATAPRGEAATAQPDRPSVAVLPFGDLGGEALSARLTHGLCQDIATELSRFRQLAIIACHAAGVEPRRTQDVRTVSAAFGVRYVLQGSVRAVGHDLRVVAHLIDGPSGEQLWAEKYDLQEVERLGPQDHLARAIVAAVAPQITAHACRLAQRTHDGPASAQTLARWAWAQACSGATQYDRAPRDAALRWADQALALAPDCTLALHALAQAQWWQVAHNTADCQASALTHGLSAASRAVELDPHDHQARLWLGQLLCLEQRVEEGLDVLRQAQALNPNCAHTLAWLGFHQATCGDPAEGLTCAQEALRLSPRDPQRACLLAALGFAHFALGDAALAAHVAQTALRDAGRSPMLLVLAVIAWAGSGDLAQARAAFQTLSQVAPRVAQARLAGQWLAACPCYRQRAHSLLRLAAG